MEKRIHPAARVFAILFAILFVICGGVAILVFNCFNLAFDSSLYKNTLSDSGIYKNLPKLIGEQITYQLEQDPCYRNTAACTEEQSGSVTLLFSGIDSNEWKSILSKLIDPVWFQSQTESGIDQIFRFVKSPGQPFNLELSLVEFKNRLGGEDGYQAMLLLIHALEPCTTGELLKLSAGIFTSSNLNLAELCLPSESILKIAEEPIRALMRDLASALPDNTSSLFQGTSSNLGSNLVVTLRAIQMIRLAAMMIPLVPLFFLLLITILAVRNIRGFLSWWGIPLTILGALLLISSLFITPAVRAFLLVRFNIQELAPGVADLIRSMALNIARSFEVALMVQAGLLCIAGILMVILYAAATPKPAVLPGA
jgi:hypothetical protein